ncbi:carbonic anhydrase [Trichloromonas sp.]|uniref:carbonic anhydrase n=1 Tax=Trichloromonas sp. TaxID=3069249 RepID=UPI003D8185D4
MKDVKEFVAGFQRFQSGAVGPDTELFDELKQGQTPRALLIGCSDSRVDPAILTDCAPGDLFVVRNVANLVPPCQTDASYHGVSAALEYAVCHLMVGHIIVLGHSQCGGINALMSGTCSNDEHSFIGRWVKIGERAKQKVLQGLPEKSPEMQQRACEQASILLSLDNLMTFPWLRQRVEEGSLALHGWYFDLQAGSLLGYCPDSGSFDPLV